jgi:hypothetical protein
MSWMALEADVSVASASRPQLIEQGFRLLQVERIEAFGEPAVDRSEEFAGFLGSLNFR